jgi:hypothetical protein
MIFLASDPIFLSANAIFANILLATPDLGLLSRVASVTPRCDLPVPYPAIAKAKGSSAIRPLTLLRISRVKFAVSISACSLLTKSSWITP